MLKSIRPIPLFFFFIIKNNIYFHKQMAPQAFRPGEEFKTLTLSIKVGRRNFSAYVRCGCVHLINKSRNDTKRKFILVAVLPLKPFFQVSWIQSRVREGKLETGLLAVFYEILFRGGPQLCSLPPFANFGAVHYNRLLMFPM